MMSKQANRPGQGEGLTRRRALQTAAAGAGVVAAGQLSFPAILRAQADAIKIGHLTPLTGFLGQIGEYAVMGAQLAVEEANAGGGVRGQQVTVITEDSVNPATATQKAQKLIEQDQASCLIGEISSASGLAIAEVNDQGIARRLTWRVQAGDESIVVERAGGLDAIAAKHVFEGARESDGVAISVVRDTARYIAMAAANLAIAVDPEVVVIGGPITSASDLLRDALRQDFDRRLPPPMVSQVRCEFSPLGEDAIAIGAARLAMSARG